MHVDQPSTTATTYDAGVQQLIEIMARLRDPETGCDWDKIQTFQSIAPYTIEEAYEVADAIERADMDELRDELGDLLLQVVYHAQIASEAGHFTFADVAAAISDKMIRRHPHVFGEASVSPGWEAIKATERAQKSDDASALAGVAVSLPALKRASKLQKRAARVGFDWPDSEGPAEKVVEELAEVRSAVTHQEREEEIGDLLFAVVNLARHLGIDAESALRRGNAKFERRFRAMEQAAGETFPTLSLAEMEALWQQAKQP